MEPNDAEDQSVDQGSLFLKSPWRGRNPEPRYDEMSDFRTALAEETARRMKCAIDDDIMSILRRTVQDDAGAGESPS